MLTKHTAPFQFLEEIARKKLSGYIFVTDPKDKSIVWKIYLNREKLYYATSANGQKERLACLWQQQQINLPLPKISSGQCEYKQLCSWWISKKLPESSLRKVIINLTQEALGQVISFESTQVAFYPETERNPLFIDYYWQELWEISEHLNHYWHKIRPNIHSAFARLYLHEKKVPLFFNLWKQQDRQVKNDTFFRDQKLSFWLMYLPKRYSIYQLAAEIKVNPLHLAHQFQIFTKQKAIHVLPYGRNPNNIIEQYQATPIRPTIACIDDSKTVQKQVKMTLETAGYSVVSILDPSQSLKAVVQAKPVLILLDINMPNIDGYQLCQMLRKSRQLKDIPIIMLTGRNTAIDKIRSKMIGVVDYLTKPCNPNKLIETVDRTVKSQMVV
ncbi:MAG: response regulator [Prochloraceae cyanobacterium]|nr:response regulator [Prochloraceae cyanobacterium]